MGYLDYEVTELPDSVENLFCKPLDELGVIERASDNQMKIILFGVTATQQQIDEMYGEFKEKFMLISILEDRLKHLNCSLDKASLILISISCETPGEVVMYANYIAYKTKTLGLDSLNMEKLCTEIFPNGFFTKQTLKDHWDKQKVKVGGNRGSDNLLDYHKASQSIMK